MLPKSVTLPDAWRLGWRFGGIDLRGLAGDEEKNDHEEFEIVVHIRFPFG
jgi:hypothetical protein